MHADTPHASRNTCLALCQAHTKCSINVSCVSKNSINNYQNPDYLIQSIKIHITNQSTEWVTVSFRGAGATQTRCVGCSLTSNTCQSLWSKLSLPRTACPSKQPNPVFLFPMRKRNQVCKGQSDLSKIAREQDQRCLTLTHLVPKPLLASCPGVPCATSVTRPCTQRRRSGIPHSRR